MTTVVLIIYLIGVLIVFYIDKDHDAAFAIFWPLCLGLIFVMSPIILLEKWGEWLNTRAYNKRQKEEEIQRIIDEEL
jgi:hypothetical protein